MDYKKFDIATSEVLRSPFHNEIIIFNSKGIKLISKLNPNAKEFIPSNSEKHIIGPTVNNSQNFNNLSNKFSQSINNSFENITVHQKTRHFKRSAKAPCLPGYAINETAPPKTISTNLYLSPEIEEKYYNERYMNNLEPCSSEDYININRTISTEEFYNTEFCQAQIDTRSPYCEPQWSYLNNRYISSRSSLSLVNPNLLSTTENSSATSYVNDLDENYYSPRPMYNCLAMEQSISQPGTTWAIIQVKPKEVCSAIVLENIKGVRGECDYADMFFEVSDISEIESEEFSEFQDESITELEEDMSDQNSSLDFNEIEIEDHPYKESEQECEEIQYLENSFNSELLIEDFQQEIEPYLEVESISNATQSDLKLTIVDDLLSESSYNHEEIVNLNEELTNDSAISSPDQLETSNNCSLRNEHYKPLKIQKSYSLLDSTARTVSKSLSTQINSKMEVPTRMPRTLTSISRGLSTVTASFKSFLHLNPNASTPKDEIRTVRLGGSPTSNEAIQNSIFVEKTENSKLIKKQLMINPTTTGTVSKSSNIKPSIDRSANSLHGISPRGTLASALRKSEAIKRQNLFPTDNNEGNIKVAPFLFK